MSKVTIRRSVQPTHISIPKNIIRSNVLSWPARSILIALLTFEDGESISKEFLIGMGPIDPATGQPARGAGDKAMTSYFRELRETGYLRMTCTPAIQNEGDASAWDWEYEPFETPIDPSLSRKVIRAQKPKSNEDSPVPPSRGNGNGSVNSSPVPPSKVDGSQHKKNETMSQNSRTPFERARASGVDITPDLTPLVTVNSLSLSSTPGQKATDPGSLAPARIPDGPEAAKTEAEREEDFLSESEEGEQTEQAEQPAAASVTVDRHDILQQAMPKLSRPAEAGKSQNPGRAHPGSETPSHGTPADKPLGTVYLGDKKRQAMLDMLTYCRVNGLEIPPELEALDLDLSAEAPLVGSLPAAPLTPPPTPSPKPATGSIRAEDIQARLKPRSPEVEARAEELRQKTLKSETSKGIVMHGITGYAAEKPAQPAAQVDPAVREAELDALMALEPEARALTLYERYLKPNNPNPDKDAGNLATLTRWLRTQSREVWAATVDAAHEAHAKKRYAIKYLEDCLKRKGFTQAQEVAHA